MPPCLHPSSNHPQRTTNNIRGSRFCTSLQECPAPEGLLGMFEGAEGDVGMLEGAEAATPPAQGVAEVCTDRNCAE
eukprot:12683054-Alexandrium_andersonii.AAC.1